MRTNGAQARPRGMTQTSWQCGQPRSEFIMFLQLHLQGFNSCGVWCGQ